MVLRSSDRISRVPPYLIRAILLRVRGYHPSCPASQLVPLTITPRLVRVRSPLLTESLLMSFPPGTEMFQFPGFAFLTLYIQVKNTCFTTLVTARKLSIIQCQVGCPIRKSMDQSLLPAPHSLSQVITSFIASYCPGIHQTPFSRLIRSRRKQNEQPKLSALFPSDRKSFDHGTSRFSKKDVHELRLFKRSRRNLSHNHGQCIFRLGKTVNFHTSSARSH